MAMQMSKRREKEEGFVPKIRYVPKDSNETRQSRIQFRHFFSQLSLINLQELKANTKTIEAPSCRDCIRRKVLDADQIYSLYNYNYTRLI